MGVSDNPKCIAGWLIGGFAGAINLVERLKEEGYVFDDEEQTKIRQVRDRLDILSGGGQPDAVAGLQEVISNLRHVIDRYKARFGELPH